MANMKFRTTTARDGWEIVNPVTGVVDLTIILPADDATRTNLMLYGHKQVVADGGAADKGATYAERLQMMRDRQAAVINGSWAFRDGHGTSTRFPDGDVFAALVALGLTKSTDEKRAAWAKLPQAARTKMRARADVAEWISNNTDDAAADEAAAEFLDE